MSDLLTKIRTAKAKRAAYQRTIAEIESMPIDVAIDLGIFREDARDIAYRAVYGR